MVNAATEPAAVAVDEETQQQAVELVEVAAAITIETDADYDRAGELLRGRVKRVLKEIDRTFDEPIHAAHVAHRAILAAKKRLTDPLHDAERTIKSAMGRYHHARLAEQRQLERERLQAARREAETRRLEEAAELEAAGHAVEADAVLDQPVTPVVEAPAPPPKAAGIGVRTVRKFRYTNESAIDRKFLIPDEKKIGALVRQLGADAESIVGGIEVYSVPSVSAR